MRTALSTIQTFHKLGRILSTIVLVISVLVFVFSLTCAVLAASGLENTVYDFFSVGSPFSSGVLYLAISSAFLSSLGEIIISRYAVKYFKSELNSGTPFNRDNAKKLRNLGIMNIAIPIMVVVLKSVLHMVLKNRFGDIGENEYELISPVAIGLMFIVLSLVCRYGSEIDVTEGGEKND